MIKGRSKAFPLFFILEFVISKKGTVQSFKIWIDVKGSLKIMEKSSERLKRFLKTIYY